MHAELEVTWGSSPTPLLPLGAILTSYFSSKTQLIVTIISQLAIRIKLVALMKYHLVYSRSFQGCTMTLVGPRHFCFQWAKILKNFCATVCWYKHEYNPSQIIFVSFCVLCLVAQSCPTLCDCHGLQPSRFLCLWGFSRQEYWSGLPCSPQLLKEIKISPWTSKISHDPEVSGLSCLMDKWVQEAPSRLLLKCLRSCEVLWL